VCGIAGFAGSGDRADIRRMTDAMVHRGPDGEGFYIDDAARVYLGHRRLAIVDIAAGHQPMWTADAQHGVVFNGEIYNHGELRAALVARGHCFVSDHSDTEVLLHGYKEWGEELPLRLNGMFAFVIYDKARNRLFGARDRFGEKPLYYSHGKNHFAFASELTALAEHPGVDRSLNTRSLQKFFAYGYLPSPHAMLNGAAKLPGGSSLVYDIASGRLDARSYWQFSLEPDESLGDADEDRLIDECGALLSQAARRRLMSDVPLGIFLSGGLDSSLVLASLCQSMPGSALQTFTIGFEEPSFDESAHARVVAEHLGTVHRQQCLNMQMARETVTDVLSRLDEPLGDASILPTQLLCAFARKHVTVALSGDGGDELFAGYDPFVALGPAQIYEKTVPDWLHKGVRRLVDMLPVSHANMSLDFKLRRTLMGLSYESRCRLPVWMAPLDPRDMAELYDAPLRVDDVYDEAIALWDAGGNKPAVDKALEFFTRFYLQDDILMKSDRAAMMNSLEARAVFLDNDLAEFCRRLPNRFKFQKGERKYLLKRVAERMLPRSITERKKKGFGIPLAKWLEHVPATLPLQPVSGVKSGYAGAAFAGHRSGGQDNRLFLWSWMSMQAFNSRLASA